jgi:N-acetylmuramoyl-L-alanine amidase
MRRRYLATALLAIAVVVLAVAAAVALGSGGSSVHSDYAVATAGLQRLEPANGAVVLSQPAATATTSTRSTTTAPAPSPRLPLAGKTVAIDPGHNGANGSHPSEINRQVDIGNAKKACDTAGAETASGYAEAAYTFDVALRVRRVLQQLGARVVLTRRDNNGVGPCINERAAIGNRAHADAAVSIHADGGPSSGRGFHVIYPPPIAGLTDDIAAPSKQLAIDLRAAYQAGTGMPRANYIGTDGLDARTDLGGLNLSDVPKVFIETGNMANATDAAKLESAGFRQRAARAIAQGIQRFLQG